VITGARVNVLHRHHFLINPRTYGNR